MNQEAIIRRLIEELDKTTICYWTNPPTNLTTILTLWLTSAVLLACCRAVSFGLIFDLTHVILAIMAFLMQGSATFLYLFRAEAGGAREEVPKLLRLLIVVWILSLAFFSPNLFPGLKMSDYLHPWKIAGLYSLVAVALLAFRTVQKNHRDAPGEPIDYWNILFWSLLVLFINSLFFFLFVLDSYTTNIIKDNLDTLKRTF